MRSNPWLKKLYRQYNKKYFGNKLPDIWVDFGDARTWRQARLSKNTCAATFIDNGKPIGILIRYYKFKGSAYTKADLLHELCHVAHPRAGHGKVFQDEIKRLVDEGAFKGIL